MERDVAGGQFIPFDSPEFAAARARTQNFEAARTSGAPQSEPGHASSFVSWLGLGSTHTVVNAPAKRTKIRRTKFMAYRVLEDPPARWEPTEGDPNEPPEGDPSADAEVPTDHPAGPVKTGPVRVPGSLGRAAPETAAASTWFSFLERLLSASQEKTSTKGAGDPTKRPKRRTVRDQIKSSKLMRWRAAPELGESSTVDHHLGESSSLAEVDGTGALLKLTDEDKRSDFIQKSPAEFSPG